MGRGRKVLLPFGDNTRYDLVVENYGRFTRIQCKTGRMRRGAVVFAVASSQYHRGGKRQDYRGQADAFGVFCPDNEKIYIIPIEHLPLAREAKLRLTAPRNSQVKGSVGPRNTNLIPDSSVGRATDCQKAASQGNL